MFSNKKRLVAAVALAISAGFVNAADTSAEQIRQINEQMAVLSARLNELELEAKIAQKKEEIRKISAVPESASSMGLQTGNDIPTVRAIDGVDGKLKATLLMRNGGGVQTVSEGEKFGAWTVKTISVNMVSLAKGKETIKLNFGTEQPSSQQGTNGFGAGVGAPAIPGIPSGPGAIPQFPR